MKASWLTLDFNMAKYKVVFKETYMSHAVERECIVPNEAEVIRIYGLNEPDIEWYEISVVD